jgi:3D (Asp-Asp-Asp) domain-containing protein
MKILLAVFIAAFLLIETVGSPVPFTATAYALRGKTASGHPVKRGVVAADPKVLPLGTKIKIHNSEYSGIYVVRDTGGRIKGKKLDIWVPSVKEARKFGRRKVQVSIIRS